MRLLPLLVMGCVAEPELRHPFQHQAWRPVSAEADLLAELRPERLRCDGWWPEEEQLIVHTSDCNWLMVAQPARTNLPDGSVLRTQLEHGTLAASETTTGHARLWLDNTLIWEFETRIPGPRAEIPIEVELNRGWPAGTALTFHVRNHGSNVWVLRPMEVEVSPE